MKLGKVLSLIFLLVLCQSTKAEDPTKNEVHSAIGYLLGIAQTDTGNDNLSGFRAIELRRLYALYREMTGEELLEKVSSDPSFTVKWKKAHPRPPQNVLEKVLKFAAAKANNTRVDETAYGKGRHYPFPPSPTVKVVEAWREMVTTRSDELPDANTQLFTRVRDIGEPPLEGELLPPDIVSAPIEKEKARRSSAGSRSNAKDPCGLKKAASLTEEEIFSKYLGK